MIKFIKTNLVDLKHLLSLYIMSLSSSIDSYYENHIIDSLHYKILYNDEEIGYFSIYHNELITQFFLKTEYRHLSQEVFFKIKKMHYIRYAFVSNNDEFFLSHALDEYQSIDKQAYFFQDSQRVIPDERITPKLKLVHAKLSDIEKITQDSGDFFGQLEPKIKNQYIYIAKVNKDIVGYGIIERSYFVSKYASIGMFVLENKRQNGLGRSIILKLKEEVYKKEMKPIAGCWYYNHLSKRTLESAGMYTSGRLLKIHF